MPGDKPAGTMLAADTAPLAPNRAILQICRWTVGGIWLYQGLVPKLLGPHGDEVAMTAALGIPVDWHRGLLHAVGAAEIVLGLCIVMIPRRSWPHMLSAMLTAMLLVFVGIFAPHHLLGAFNPVVMNGASIALSVIALLILHAESAGAN